MKKFLKRTAVCAAALGVVVVGLLAAAWWKAPDLSDDGMSGER